MKIQSPLLFLYPLLLLAGCSAPPVTLEVPAGAPPDFPVERYRQPPGDASVYTVDAARSLLQVYAYRDGALKRLGHDHVIASRDLAGFIRRDAAGASTSVFSSDLYLPLAALTVDEAALRADAGFETEPSAEDRAGTRSNMLKSLDAATFPFVSASLKTPAIDDSALLSGQPVELTVEATLNLHGLEQALTVPVSAVFDAGSLKASGAFNLTQSDFAIEPFSVLGGALAVRDTVEIRFELYATLAAGASD